MTDDDKTKINILLKEYDTLRSEALTRVSTRYTLLGVAAAVAAFAASGSSSATTWLIMSILVILVLGVWWQSGALLKRCGDRTTQIEQQVNLIVGEKLLCWETDSTVRTGVLEWMYGPPKGTLAEKITRSVPLEEQDRG